MSEAAKVACEAAKAAWAAAKDAMNVAEGEAMDAFLAAAPARAELATADQPSAAAMIEAAYVGVPLDVICTWAAQPTLDGEGCVQWRQLTDFLVSIMGKGGCEWPMTPTP